MFKIEGVYFDNRITNWYTPLSPIKWNVIVLVVDGKVEYLIENKTVIAEPGDLLFISEGANRRGENFENTLHQKYTVVFKHIRQLNHLPEFLKNKTFVKLKIINFDFIKHHMKRLYFEHVYKQAYYSFICGGMLLELIGHMGNGIVSEDITPIKLHYVQTIQQYILQNYRKTIEINDLAKIIQKSPSYTIAVFKEVTGYTPIQYIHHLRITEACRLLKSTDMSIINISDYLGYYDASYFSRTFKKIMSMSPREFSLKDIGLKTNKKSKFPKCR